MDFLKYLDVLIGLAVVMVLLSPAVTAITQFCLWFGNHRSKFLRQTIQRLVSQLEPGTNAAIQVWDPTGKPAGGVTVGTLGITNSAGSLPLPAGFPTTAGKTTQLALTADGHPLPGYFVAATHGVGSVDPPPAGGAPADPPGVARASADAAGVASVALPVRARVIDDANALAIAKAVVAHPMVARGPVPNALVRVPPLNNRNAEVIEREEFIRILLELACGELAATCGLKAGPRDALLRALAMNGVADPAASLSAIRTKAQE